MRRYDRGDDFEWTELEEPFDFIFFFFQIIRVELKRKLQQGYANDVNKISKSCLEWLIFYCHIYVMY